MSTALMVSAAVSALLIGLAAHAAERVAGWYGRPRRWIWAAAVASSLLLPFAGAWLPDPLPLAWPHFEPSDGATPEGAGAPIKVVGATTPHQPLLDDDAPPALPLDPGLLGAIWLALSSLMVAGMIGGYLRLRSLRSRCDPAEIEGIPVHVSSDAGPAVVGYVRPTIIVPRWLLCAPRDERRLILLHEREHVAGHDVWLFALGALAIAAMPWNPTLWWQQRRLRLAAETDCDARVLARGGSRCAYGRALIRAAGSRRAFSRLAPAWGEASSHLERRILAMTSRSPERRLLRALPTLAIAAGLLVLACDTTSPPRDPTSPAPRPGVVEEGATLDSAVATISLRGVMDERIPVLLELEGEIRVEWVSGLHLGTSADGSIELVTPAELRLRGSTDYRLTARALEDGDRVEISMVRMVEGTPHAASARGPTPMISSGSFREVVTYADRALQYKTRLAEVRHTFEARMAELQRPQEDSSRPAPEPDAAARAAAVAAERAAVAARRAAGQGESGLVRVESLSGEPVRVRIVPEVGGLEVATSVIRGGPDAVTPGSKGAETRPIELTTPAVVRIPAALRFRVIIDTVDPDARVRVQAIGGRGYGFGSVRAEGSRFVVYRDGRGAGIESGRPR